MLKMLYVAMGKIWHRATRTNSAANQTSRVTLKQISRGSSECKVRVCSTRYLFSNLLSNIINSP
jgi:hypothetical protein